MITAAKRRLGRDDDQGFTLIELMVVVLIIAILLAIAIPTFLGARNKANARAAQSSLRNALTAEQTYYTDSQAFGTAMSTIEPNLTWQTTAPAATANANTIGVQLLTNATAGDSVLLQANGADNNCYSILQVNAGSTANPGTYYSATKGACAQLGSATLAALTAGTGKASATIGATGAPGTWYTSW